MKAMIFERPGRPLRPVEAPTPEPGAGQVLLRVRACGVCRTDLHVVDGELPDPIRPLVPGHEIVGEVVRAGQGVSGIEPGVRVGVPWLGHTCGACAYCRGDRENLCDHALFTGYTLNGGYATHAVADAAYCFELPPSFDDARAAPLLCAGLIGYRSWRMAGGEAAKRLGVYGFGAAAHITAQVARHAGQELYAFVRPGDGAAIAFAKDLGAAWAGPSDENPPVQLDAAIIFAPVGDLVLAALRAVRKGGTVVCGGIHMSDIPSFPYRVLWEERALRSVANLTRRDAVEFLRLAPEVPVRTEVETFPLAEANEALERLRAGQLRGAAVLIP